MFGSSMLAGEKNPQMFVVVKMFGWFSLDIVSFLSPTSFLFLRQMFGSSMLAGEKNPQMFDVVKMFG